METRAQRPVVLVIDDDPLVRELVQETLSTQPYDVLAAGTAADGLKRCREREPRVVLLDVDLGDEPNGVELCRQLKERHQGLDVVFLSGLFDAEVAAAGRAAGAVEYLTKPFSPLALLDVIRQIVAET